MTWFSIQDDDARNDALKDKINSAQTDEELDQIERELAQYTQQNDDRLDGYSNQVGAYDKLANKR